MAGSIIEGYWRWFTGTGARHARRFPTREAAMKDTPQLKGTSFLGNRVVMRVAFEPAEDDFPWSADMPEIFPGPETVDEYLERCEQEMKAKEAEKDGHAA
jgi:hypothetical protein